MGAGVYLYPIGAVNRTLELIRARGATGTPKDSINAIILGGIIDEVRYCRRAVRMVDPVYARHIVGMQIPFESAAVTVAVHDFGYIVFAIPDISVQISQAEEFLKKLGFKQVRVRHHGHIARIEIEAEEFPKIIEHGTREEIVKNFKKFGYTYVSLDLAGYRTGSMNEPLPQSVKKK